MEKTNLPSCQMCDGQQFNELDGYFYCAECGTKQDQIRAVEIEQDLDFNENSKNQKFAKTQKIHKEKAPIPELTSWECYNYILRGLVEKLLQFGVKEEFKLMVLQLWAAFLRRKEVAFFNKTHAELPKLGVKYFPRDARTLYNHQTQKKKTTSRCSDGESNKSQGTNNSVSKREWRKSKRKLDASAYSVLSSESSMPSSSSGTIQPVIKLQFSSKARKYYKNKMSAQHLEKHAQDGEGSMSCHRTPTSRELNRTEYLSTMLNIKQLYTIIGVALNLVEDEMQLSDLVRMINDETIISERNVLQFFPQNVARKTSTILAEINFYYARDKYTDKDLRLQTSILARFLNINKFKLPNMQQLVQRYVTELALPDEVTEFIKRLMNLLPPSMKTRVEGLYPAYEARAMAYIVFVLKLFFGLDGYKEKLISDAAITVNKELLSCGDNSPAALFVWSEWMEYIEMRKVIISQYNCKFSKQFKQYQSISQKSAELATLRECKKQQEAVIDEVYQKPVQNDIGNIRRVMELFLLRENAKPENAENSSPPNGLVFPASLMPATEYFDLIKTALPNCAIPDIMRLQHRKRTLLPYFGSSSFRELREFLHTHDIHLDFKTVACTTNRKFMGIFRSSDASTQPKESTKEADFNIETNDWLQGLTVEALPQELIFHTDMKSYHPRHINRLARQAKMKYPRVEEPYVHSEVPLIAQKDIKMSSQIFSEFDMQPIEGLDLHKPRRGLDTCNLFDNLSDVEEDECSMPAVKEEHVKSLDLLASNFDCWMLLGNVHGLKEAQKADLMSRLPPALNWLLDTCAQSICVESSIVFEELLIIELMYNYGIENLDELKNCVYFRYNVPIKELNSLLNIYREMW